MYGAQHVAVSVDLKGLDHMASLRQVPERAWRQEKLFGKDCEPKSYVGHTVDGKWH